MLVNNSKLWELLQSDENDQLDFKSAELLTNPDGQNRYKIAKHLAGFANHRGGRIVFGVDDSGEIEGEDLREDECLSTISEVANSMCSPSVNFSHNFYSDDRGDLSEGAILELDVVQRTSLPPVAVIESSEGKIRKREYRIRSGDSTRLVSDGELVALFSENPDLEIAKSTFLTYVHSEDLEPVSLTPRPNYYNRIDELYAKIGSASEEILETITEEPGEGHTRTAYPLVFKRVMICLILRDISTLNKNRTLDLIYDEFVDENPSLGYELTFADPTVLHHEGEEDDLFEKIPFGLMEIVEDMMDRVIFPEQHEMGILLPKEAEIELPDGFNSIKISVDGEFEFYINIEMMGYHTGLPDEHPESRSDAVGADRDLHRSRRTMLARIETSANFNYPEQSHSEYVTSKKYCEILANRIISKFDWSGFLDDIPSKKMFKIEEQIAEIDEKIDHLVENS